MMEFKPKNQFIRYLREGKNEKQYSEKGRR